MRATPRARVAAARSQVGNEELVRRCLELLAETEGDVDLIQLLGGPAALALLSGGIPEGQRYWLRVWALRGLLWADLAEAPAPLAEALRDDHWRVREMASKVVARHRLGELIDQVAACEADPVKRVREAARRASMRILERG